ncbi:MAG: prepilin-type N-terminal cleavage/methylation domain-containing protein [Nitrospiraceae bacterium]|nr:MAG: prepilin-type N-terminal cleavage/methylation domain-containing protein [Nitrospiraceae bacterium]
MKKSEVKNQKSKGFRNNKKEVAGFTLIEVIIAMVILSISLVLVMQLFAGGLRAARTSCDYSRAIIHAKDKMSDLFANPVQETGSFDDGYRWETEVQPYKELEESQLKLMEIKVKVMWDDVRKKPRTVELVGLKVITDEENL